MQTAVANHKLTDAAINLLAKRIVLLKFLDQAVPTHEAILHEPKVPVPKVKSALVIDNLCIAKDCNGQPCFVGQGQFAHLFATA